jgi:hypothetical protein
MTRDDIIRMAREAWVLPDAHIPNVLEFANLVAATALRARLAQPEPEPVAWMYQHEDTGLTMCVVVQQVEPGFEKNNPKWQKIMPLYNAPPQREWQGLTENEIKHLWYEACQTNLELTSQLIVHLARNIEAKLKEKNNG